MLVGFFAAGRAGKAPAAPKFAVDCVRLGAGEGRVELVLDDTAGAGRSASQSELVEDDAPLVREGRDGKDIDELEDLYVEPPVALLQLLVATPPAPTDRELCAVELFSFKTLDVPARCPKTPAAVDGPAPEGPGNVG